MTILVRIVAPSFVAGAEIDGERIVRIAPLLAWHMRNARARGRSGLRELVRRNRWAAEVVPTRTEKA